MNRTVINLLCVLFVCILAASVLVPVFHTGAGIADGFRDGLSELSEKNEIVSAPGVLVDVIPTQSALGIKALQDTVAIDNNRQLPLIISAATVNIPVKHYTPGIIAIVWTCLLLSLIAFVLMAVQVVKFVVNINKGIIFEKKNIRCLSKTGIYLLAMAVFQVTAGLVEDYTVAQAGYTLGGVSLTSEWDIPWSSFLLGTMALLMAQVWHRGVQLREEQELTI